MTTFIHIANMGLTPWRSSTTSILLTGCQTGTVAPPREAIEEWFSTPSSRSLGTAYRWPAGGSLLQVCFAGCGPLAGPFGPLEMAILIVGR
jgi:hypothetical protein